MDLKKKLNLGQSRMQTNEIVGYVDGSPIRFKQLVNIYLGGPYKITQRAAWSLSICVERWPYLADPHLKSLISFLGNTDSHDAVKRNTMRLLQFVEIPKRYHGDIATLCFNFLGDRSVAVAIRVVSMTVLYNIIDGKPELQRELKLILEDQFHFASAAFRSRAMKILDEFKKAKIKT
jgi:hypothetical protein